MNPRRKFGRRCPSGKAFSKSIGQMGVTNDERLATIWNQKRRGTTLSKFDYEYDVVLVDARPAAGVARLDAYYDPNERK